MKTWAVAQWFQPLSEGQAVRLKDEAYRASSRAFTVELTMLTEGKYMVRAHRNSINVEPYLLCITDKPEEIGPAIIMALADARITA